MKKTLPLLIAGLFFVTVSCCNKKSKAPAIPEDMFCITALEDGVEVSMELYSKDYPHTTPSLLYSLNGKAWTDFIIGQTVVTLSKSGTRLYMKANRHNTAFGCEPGPEAPFNVNSNSFKFSKKTKVSGNIMYLLEGENPESAEMGESAFSNLFLFDSLLVDASELQLPAMRLSRSCYSEMFEYTSISTTPILPATELAPYCYTSMFGGCHNLTIVPELPATKLDTACYSGMFDDCMRLNAAPELPATQLAQACYTYMFQNCTSLTVGPKLPAGKLEAYCCYHMFSGCTSLTSLTCMATDISAEMCLGGWLKKIETKGTLHAVAGTDWAGHIPATWTVEYE